MDSEIQVCNKDRPRAPGLHLLKAGGLVLELG